MIELSAEAEEALHKVLEEPRNLNSDCINLYDYASRRSKLNRNDSPLNDVYHFLIENNFVTSNNPFNDINKFLVKFTSEGRRLHKAGSLRKYYNKDIPVEQQILELLEPKFESEKNRNIQQTLGIEENEFEKTMRLLFSRGYTNYEEICEGNYMDCGFSSITPSGRDYIDNMKKTKPYSLNLPPTIFGDGNVVNIAGGNIYQSGTTISVTEKQGDINQNVLTNKTGSTRLNYLIDVSGSLKKFGLSDAYHWLFTIKMNGKNISAPQLNKQYIRFNDNVWTKMILNFINIATTKNTVSEVKYEYLYNELSYHIETALSLSKNNIQFEYAQYKPKDLMTNFGGELLPSLLLLYFCETFYNDNSNIDIEITVEVTANGTLYFQASEINFFNINRSLNTYTMSENKYTINERITNFENATVIDILEKVVEGYASVSKTNPFLAIDAVAQQKTLNTIRDTVFKQFRNL